MEDTGQPSMETNGANGSGRAPVTEAGGGPDAQDGLRRPVTAGLEQSAWTQQEKRVIKSTRYRQLCELGGSASFEPACLERQIVAAVAPDRELPAVVGRIHEIYDEIRRNKKDMIDGVPALRAVKQKCTNTNCDNDDPNDFIPSRGGAVACMRCGDCQSDYVIHEGEMYRNFAGEEDRSHHGPALNPLYSASYNLGTQFTGLRGQKRNTGRETDFSVSNIGRDGAAVGGTMATRVEYKDDQKSKAFRIMREQGANLALHGLVRKKAAELFAAYRDARDRLFDFEAVVAACLIAAHLEVLVEEGSDGSGVTFAFACPGCGLRGFTAKRDAEKHCVVSTGPAGSSDSMEGSLEHSAGAGGRSHGGGRPQSWRKASCEVAADPDVAKMGLAETRRLLLWVSEGAPYQQAAVDGVCAGLQAEMRSQSGKESGSDGEGSGDGQAPTEGGGDTREVERESAFKAGQLLVMASLKVLTRWCGDDSEAGRLFFDYLQGVKKRKMERGALLEEEEQDRKRRRQYEERPIFQELSVSLKSEGASNNSTDATTPATVS